MNKEKLGKEKVMRHFKGALLALLILFALLIPRPAENADFEIQLNVKEFTLKNGMQFLVVERPTTPQVACRVAIRAGSALEEAGKTGIAHMLEHMMFKGTKNFGTVDPEKDEKLQQQIEETYQIVLDEQSKRNPDQALIQAKLKEMDKLRLEVQKIYVPQAFSSQLGRNGAVGVNAFTSMDQTQYIASVPSDMIDQWFSIVSEQLFEPAWREFYVEKEVVQREWAFRYVNNPDGAAWLDLHATAYTAHPYRNPVIGWKSDMERFSTTDAIRFHERYYNSTNAVCVLVGDITLEKAKNLARTYFERYPAGNLAPEEVTKEPPQLGPRKSVRYLKGAREPRLIVGFHSALMGTDDFYALDALTMVLSHGRGARMTQNIVKKGRAVEAWAYNPDNRYGSMLLLGGSPKEPEAFGQEGLSELEKREAYLRACKDLEDLLLAEAETLKTETVSERELERIKKLNYRDFLDRLRRNESVASTLATFEVQVGWRYLLTYLDKMAAVTPEDIQRVAQKYITPENKTTVYVIPGGDLDQPPEPYREIRSLSGAAAAKLFTPSSFVNHSTYPTPEGWKHPLSFDRQPKKIEYEKAGTADVDGVHVFYLPDRELPLIDVTLLVRAGAVDVGQAKTGLTDLFNNTIIQGGTKKYTPSELAMVLDENAIRLSITVNQEDTTIRLSVMKRDWERGLALLEEILTQPRFDDHILEVAKEQALIALRRQGGDAQTVSMREAMVWHFKGHPYGRDPLRGLETIPTITKKDLTEFLRTYFVPSNMVASVAGDIDESTAVQGLGRLFRGLPKIEAPKRRLEEPPETPPVVALIHKPGQVQSQVTIALRGIKRTHPDYWKMNLLMNILGGSDSLMFTRLRDDLGLVYAAYFYQTYKWEAGLMVGYIGCRGEKTAMAIEETVKIMDKLRKEVPSDELEQKRLDALNSFVFNVDTPAELVEVYSRYYMRNEPLDTLQKIQNAYLTAKPEELERLARELLQTRKIQVFVVADKTVPVEMHDGSAISLEENLKILSQGLGLSFTEIPLR